MLDGERASAAGVTGHGAALLTALPLLPALTARVSQTPLVQPALELQPTYTSRWQHHCLLPGTAPHAVLALGECAVLSASLRALGKLSVCAVDLETDARWTSRVSALLLCRLRTVLSSAQAQASGPLPQDLTVNDTFTQSFQVTPLAAGLQPAPGVLVVRWQTPQSASLGLPHAVSRLPLPAVSVEDAPLTVHTVLPESFVLGQPNTVRTCIHNRTALVQELVVTVSDVAGFVFAGERSSDIEVLPHSSTELRHTVVAHAAGWQPLPEVAITASRYVARLTALSVRDAVCVRPLPRGA